MLSTFIPNTIVAKISHEASKNENFSLESTSVQILENDTAILSMFVFFLLFVLFDKMRIKNNR